MSFFDLSEMRCKSGAAYPIEYVQMGRWGKLQTSLDRIRDAWGGPIIVLSGYREPGYNAELREKSIQRLIAKGRTREQAERETGVAKNSKHMTGEAADIRPAEGARAPQLHALVMELVKGGHLPSIGGVGKYSTWVHVDIRARLANGGITTWGSAGGE